jgi:hypothetical protein
LDLLGRQAGAPFLSIVGKRAALFFAKEALGRPFSLREREKNGSFLRERGLGCRFSLPRREVGADVLS